MNLFSIDQKVIDNDTKPIFVIGIDTADDDYLSYCLVKKIGNISEVIMSKKSLNKIDFEEEVRNISKYFEAVIVREGDDFK